RFKNVLWKYLGSKEVGEGPEVLVVPVQPGDRFLLCTDGLSGVVPDDQLNLFVADKGDMQQCADGLGQLALDQGSRDNVSCVMIKVNEGNYRPFEEAFRATTVTNTRPRKIVPPVNAPEGRPCARPPPFSWPSCPRTPTRRRR